MLILREMEAVKRAGECFVGSELEGKLNRMRFRTKSRGSILYQVVPVSVGESEEVTGVVAYTADGSSVIQRRYFDVFVDTTPEFALELRG